MMAPAQPCRARKRLRGRPGSRLRIPAGGRRPRGVALVVAMLMLVLIGAMSVAVMRNALGANRIAVGDRLLIQASQFAQLALRRCEDQLTMPPSSGTTAGIAGPSTPPAWTRAADWTGGSALAMTLVAADFSGAGTPRVFPQCLAEPAGAAGSYVVTARGFSGDFAVDSQAGAAVAGAVVWVQSMVLVVPADADTGKGGSAPCPAACPRTIVRRSWQQLLTPPF